MFGALAAAGALPFAPRRPSRRSSRGGGRASKSSLRAFARRLRASNAPPAEPSRRVSARERFVASARLQPGNPELDRLVARIRDFPQPLQPMLSAGVQTSGRFLDPAYAREYLDRLGMLFDLDRAHGGEIKGFAFTVAAAKYVAVAMAYDDVTRVADLKIRASPPRARACARVGAGAGRRSSTPPNISIRASRSFAARCRPALGRVDRGAARACSRWAVPSIAAGGSGRAPSTGYLMLRRSAAFKPSAARRCAIARETAHREAWLDGRHRHADAELRPRRRGARAPPSGQGLFGHACARPVQVRPRDGGRPDSGAARGRRRLAAPPEARALWTRTALRSTAC